MTKANNTYFALRIKDTGTFICMGYTHARFKARVSASYANKQGMRARGTTYTFADYMADKEAVMVTVDNDPTIVQDFYDAEAK